MIESPRSQGQGSLERVPNSGDGLCFLRWTKKVNLRRFCPFLGKGISPYQSTFFHYVLYYQ